MNSSDGTLAQTMEITPSGLLRVRGRRAKTRPPRACAGGPVDHHRDRGNSTSNSTCRWTIAQPELTCDNGTPRPGHCPKRQHANFTLVYDQTFDSLVSGVTNPDGGGNFEGEWLRVGGGATSGGMWPQENLEVVPEAQRFADAGESEYLAGRTGAAPRRRRGRVSKSSCTSWGRLHWDDTAAACSQVSSRPRTAGTPRSGSCAPRRVRPTSPVRTILRVRADARGWPPRVGADQPGPARPPRRRWDLGRHRVGDRRAGRAHRAPANAEASLVLEGFLGARVAGSGRRTTFAPPPPTRRSRSSTQRPTEHPSSASSSNKHPAHRGPPRIPSSASGCSPMAGRPWSSSRSG